MTFLSAHPRSYIRTWLFGLVFLASGAILVLGAISYAGFRNIKTLSTILVSKQMAQLAYRASTGRTLSGVFAKIDLISRTFPGRDDIISSEGEPLLGTLAGLPDSEIDPKFIGMLNSFPASVSAFLAACRAMNGRLAERIALEQKTHHELDELETRIGNALIQSVKEGKDPSHFEQLLALVSTYRESLLRLDKMSLSLPSVRSREEIERWLTPILASANDLALRLKTVSASSHEVASRGQSISVDIQHYQECVSRLAEAMLDVNLSIEKLNSARQGLLRMMEIEDKKTKEESHQVESEIGQVVRTAQITTLGTAVFILIQVTWLTVFITKRGIKQPLQAVIGMIGKIRSGDFPDSYTLSDIEEWRAIEIALREMWSWLAQANSQLRESEERYRTLFEAARDGMTVAEIDTGIIVSCNQALCHLIERNMEQIVGQPQSFLHPPQDLIDGQSPSYREHRRDPSGAALEDRLISKSGKIVPVEIRGTHFQVNGRHYILSVFRDITERRHAIEALRKSEEKYRGIFDESVAAIYACDDKKNFIDSNQAGLDLLGYSREELLHMSIPDVDAGPVVALPTHQQLLSGGRLVNYEHKLRRKDGTVITVLNNSRPLTDLHGNIIGMLSTLIDITEIKRAEEILKTTLQEKEVLLREIHHRVKNNMQVISSLLTLQAERLENEQARQTLLESRQRIVAMAMIHEALYGGQSLAAIDLSDYLGNLVERLKEIYSSHEGVSINLDLGKVELSIDQAVPCGLILNELVTNSFKHAFPDGRLGTIQINVRLVNGKEMVLEVSDNGVGLPPGLAMKDPSTLGLRLVQGLLKHQLDGSLEVGSRGGTTFTLRWPLLAGKGESS